MNTSWVYPDLLFPSFSPSWHHDMFLHLGSERFPIYSKSLSLVSADFSGFSSAIEAPTDLTLVFPPHISYQDFHLPFVLSVQSFFMSAMKPSIASLPFPMFSPSMP